MQISATRDSKRVTGIARLVLVILLLTLAGPGFGQANRQVRLSSPAELEMAVKAARPGDVLLLPEGTYHDQSLRFAAHGAEGKPIALRAAVPGKVVFTGKSSLEVRGAHLVVDGLVFDRCTLDPILLRDTQFCRVTQCAVRRCNPEDGRRMHWIRVAGGKARGNRIDHCYTEGKTQDGVVLVVDGSDGRMPLDTRIDHNYFKDVVRAVRNGMETIRIGTSHFGQVEARAVVEYNLFRNASGDAEIISSKSCGNTYRYNTFRDCEGGVVMRHGHRSRIEGNFFFGNGRPRTAGIRIHGTGHRVVNNYLSGLGQYSLALPAGQSKFVPAGHEPTLDCLVAHNTVVEPAGPALVLGAERSPLRDTPPTRTVFLNNLVWGRGKGVTLLQELFPGPTTWNGNLFYAEGEARAGVDPRPGLTLRDPALQQGENGLFRSTRPLELPGHVSEVGRGVRDDMDGQPRSPRPTVGADEPGSAPILRRPLRPQDVGPSWMKSSA